MMISDLPSDLLGEVFLRLPAGTLVNLRKVSKSWRALIDTPEFIRLHLSSGPHDPRLIFLTITAGFHASHYSTTGCRLESPGAIEASRRKIHGPPDAKINSASFLYHGSCNGLICLGVDNVDESRLLLWNPCTNQHKELPPPFEYPRTNRCCHTISAYGFGHDVGHDDYKVVKLSQSYNFHSNKSSDQQVQIYSLKTNSWRDVSRSPYYYSVGNIPSSDGVFANVSLHWLMVDYVDGSDVLMALDFTSEKWNVVPLPEGNDFSVKASGFTALDGCLCLMIYGHNYMQTQMWTMKQYGVKDSWTKMSFRLPCSGFTGGCCKLISYTGKRLLFLDSGVLTWYDAENGKLEKLDVFDSDRHSSKTVSDWYAFTASLVKLP